MAGLDSAPAMRVEFGHLTVSLRCSDNALRTLIARAYRGFLGCPDISLARSSWDVEIRVQGRIPNRMERLTEVDKAPLDVVLERGGIEVRSDWFNASLNAAESVAVLTTPEAVHPVDSVIRAAYVISGVKHCSTLVHGAAVRLGRGCFVLFGPSGSGKSTIARAFGDDSFADELVGVQFVSNHCVAHGTPFWAGKRQSLSVRGLAILEKSKSFGASVLKKSEAVRLLLKETQALGLDPAGMEQLYESTCEIVNNAAVVRLEFALGNDMRTKIEEILNGI